MLAFNYIHILNKSSQTNPGETKKNVRKILNKNNEPTVQQLLKKIEVEWKNKNRIMKSGCKEIIIHTCNCHTLREDNML